jgi:hypothetical protein
MVQRIGPVVVRVLGLWLLGFTPAQPQDFVFHEKRNHGASRWSRRRASGYKSHLKNHRHLADAETDCRIAESTIRSLT